MNPKLQTSFFYFNEHKYVLDVAIFGYTHQEIKYGAKHSEVNSYQDEMRDQSTSITNHFASIKNMTEWWLLKKTRE